MADRCNCFECRYLNRIPLAGLWCKIHEGSSSLSEMVSRVSEYNQANFLTKVHCDHYKPLTLADAVETAIGEVALGN